MKKKCSIHILTMMLLLFFFLSATAAAEALQVKGKRFVKGGQPVYILVGAPNECNAEFVGRASSPWINFADPLNPQYKQNIHSQLAAKKNNKIAVIQLFSALYFRGRAADGRATGLSNTVWWDGDVEKSWAKFVSPDGIKMQREMIDFVISEAQKVGVDFTFSLMWESQVLGGRRDFLPWFKAHKEYVNKKYNVPVGIHSHKEDHVAAADFAVIEGDYAKHLHMFDIDKPVVILARNPGKFTPRNKCKSYNDNWKALARQLQIEMLEEFKVLGATGFPYPRWVDKKTMVKEMDACKDRIINYDFKAFDASIKFFCKQLVAAAKTGDFDSVTLIEAPEPTQVTAAAQKTERAKSRAEKPAAVEKEEEPAAPAGLTIKGKRFTKKGKPVYFLVGEPDACNAQFVGEGEKQWSQFGAVLDPEYKRKFRAKLDSLKDEKTAVIQLFTAPIFQEQAALSSAAGLEEKVDRKLDHVNKAVEKAGEIKKSLKTLASVLKQEKERESKISSGGGGSALSSWKTVVSVGDSASAGSAETSSVDDDAEKMKALKKSMTVVDDVKDDVKSIIPSKSDKIQQELKNSVWWDGDIEKSWAKFVSPEGVKMQRELIDFVISQAKEAGVDFTFSLMREAQTLSGRPEFLPWFKAHKEYIEKTYAIPVGIHSNLDLHIAAADFAVGTGESAKDANMLNKDKPVIILARDPGKFSPGNECSAYNDDWQAVAKQLQTEMVEEFKQLGATGFPSKRWVDKETMKRELADCPDKIKDFDFTAFAGKMEAFCKRLLKEARKGNFDAADLID